MNLNETGCEGVDWMHLVKVRDHWDNWQAPVNMVMNIWVP